MRRFFWITVASVAVVSMVNADVLEEGGGGTVPCKYTCEPVSDFVSKHTGNTPSDPPVLKYWRFTDSFGCFRKWYVRSIDQKKENGPSHVNKYKERAETTRDCEPDYEKPAKLVGSIALVVFGPEFQMECWESCIADN